MSATKHRPVPRITLTPEESAASLGMSLSHFKRHVQPHIPAVRSGRARHYRVRDLERWADDHADRGQAA